MGIVRLYGTRRLRGSSGGGGGGGSWPAWRTDPSMTPLHVAHAIPNSSLDYSKTHVPLMFAGSGEEGLNDDINLWGVAQAWNGISTFGTNVYIMSSGGENQWYNASVAIDLGQDAPRWRILRRSSRHADYANDYHNLDGSPVGRHVYQSQASIKGSHLLTTADHKDRIMMFAYQAGSAPTPVPLAGAGGGAVVDAWRIVDGAWDDANTWPATTSASWKGTYAPPAPGAFVPHATDPNTSDHYFIGDRNDGTFGNCIIKWRAADNTYHLIATSPFYPTGGYGENAIGNPLHAGNPATWDSLRNKFIHINGWDPARSSGHDTGCKVQIQPVVEGVTNVTTNVYLENAYRTLNAYNAGLCYDPDNDWLVFAPTGTNSGGTATVYFLHPTSAVVLGSTTYPTPSTGDYVMCRLQYMADLGGVVLIPDSYQPIHFISTRAAP